MIIECPSGLKGEARRIKGHEIQAIADKLADDEDVSEAGLISVLNGCWVNTIDSGPYSCVSTGTVNVPWRKVLKGDLIPALLNIRVGSFRDGKDYTFLTRCPLCKKPFRWTIDIKKALLSRTRPLSDAGRAHLDEGGSDLCMNLEVLPDMGGEGRIVPITYRLATLQRDKAAEKWKKQQLRRKERVSKEDIIIDQLANQITGIEGKGGRELDHRKRWKWVKDLGAQEIYDLRDAFEAAECGIDTSVTVRCENASCEYEFDVDLPFGPSFLDPSRLDRRERLFGAVGETEEEREYRLNPTEEEPKEKGEEPDCADGPAPDGC